jgi:hypothetical protein
MARRKGNSPVGCTFGFFLSPGARIWALPSRRVFQGHNSLKRPLDSEVFLSRDGTRLFLSQGPNGSGVRAWDATPLPEKR